MSRHRARKRFGQHFLVDPGVIGAILDAIAPRGSDRIVEIGPGQGALTGLLARTGCELHAIEIDRDLAATDDDTLLALYRQEDGEVFHDELPASYFVAAHRAR